jgi:hypothetical protein
MQRTCADVNSARYLKPELRSTSASFGMPDPDPDQSDKPDPHKSETPGTVEAHSGDIKTHTRAVKAHIVCGAMEDL